MDQPGLDVRDHRAALEGLRRVNWISRSVPAIWRELRQMTQQSTDRQPLRVLDVACGGGDVAIRLARLANRQGIAATFDGCDLSDTALDVARAAAQNKRVRLNFFRLDALRQQFPEDYDVIMCSLFLHHLGDDDAAALLRKMSQAARRAVLIDDLLRTRWGYLLCWFGVRLLSRSPVVHADGPWSVQAAFTEAEVRGIAKQAGLNFVRLQRHWPQRFLLSWIR